MIVLYEYNDIECDKKESKVWDLFNSSFVSRGLARFRNHESRNYSDNRTWRNGVGDNGRIIRTNARDNGDTETDIQDSTSLWYEIEDKSKS